MLAKTKSLNLSYMSIARSGPRGWRVNRSKSNTTMP